MRRILLMMCCLLAVPVLTYAGSDIVATYKYADGNMMTLCTRDAGHVRMDTSPDSYMLLKGDKVYAVSKDDEGNWHAMDLDQMQGMGGFTSMFGGGASEYEVRYEKQNKSEKVAGYSGKVYTAIVYEGGKVVSRDDIVLSTHADIKKLSDGWNAIAARMGQAMGPQMAQFVEHSSREAKKWGMAEYCAVVIRCGCTA
ncbi:hypothetical protein [Oleidesulfovibrio sp.]|uniref:hypothetical protein n=1 Tax=Oleidesulfovibrio sp. TaxID=2909707 RepID=UPI003A842C79